MKRCPSCGKKYGDNLPFCRDCFNTKWDSSVEFIKPKHSPLLLPLAMKTYRSVVTMDFIVNKTIFIQTVAINGNFYYDNKHNSICCFLNQVLGSVSGSAIPAYSPWPTYPLDSLMVIDAVNSPHVIAIDCTDVNKNIAIGRIVPI